MTFFTTAIAKNYNPLKKHDVFLTSVTCACLLSGLVIPSSEVFANVKPVGADQLSVLGRENPAYTPAGLRAGDFIFHSGINTGVRYTDNVYATKDNATSDYYTTVSPDLSITSDFIRHSLSASVSGERGFYNKVKRENYTDYRAQVGGRFDISGQTAIPFSVGYSQEHYRRGSEDERVGTEPTTFNLLESSLGIVQRGQTLMVQAIATLKDYAFKKISSAAGFIDNSDQDRAQWSLYTSVGIQDEAILAPFAYSELTDISYDQKIGNSGLQRSSSGYEFGVGSIVNFSKVTRASFNIGHVTRSFDDPRFSDVTGLAYGLDLIWEPSTLTSFELEGKRSIQETIADRSPSSVNSSLNFSVTYELFPNVIVNPYAGFNINEYEGIDRSVESKSAGLSVNYKMNQNLWLTTSYGYITQNETGRDAEAREYDANTYNLSLKLQF